MPLWWDCRGIPMARHTTLCERLARQLQGRYHLPVYFVDERYSSAVVDSDATWIDDEAAAVILQQYFDETSQKDQ